MSAIDEITAWGPRDYVKIDVKPGEKMVDIGPGRYEHPRANLYIDCDVFNVERLRKEGKNAILSDLDEGLPEIADKEFDYVWCSHVFEHAAPDQLEKWAATLSRIAKRGTIVLPSAYKDSLFNFEEDEHRWSVLPNPTNGAAPIFVELNSGYIARLKDQTVQKAMCFLYRTGTQHDCTAERYLRAWYQQFEPSLDVVYHWEGSLELIIIR